MQALYRLEALVSREGWDAERLRLAGDLWREAGNLGAALVYWQRALQITPNDPTLLRDFASVAITRNEWAQAADALRTLRRLMPDDEWVALQYGVIRASIDRVAVIDLRVAANEPAYAPLANALIEILDDPETLNDGGARALRVGIVLADAEMWSQAELALETAADDPSLRGLALAYLSYARDKNGKDGSSQIMQAVTLEPENTRIRYLQALHLRHTNEFQESLRVMQIALLLEPESAAVNAELGVAYWLLGDRVNAEMWMRQALALSGGDARYQDMINAVYTEEQTLLERFGIDLDNLLVGATAEAAAEAVAEVTPEITLEATIEVTAEATEDLSVSIELTATAQFELYNAAREYFDQWATSTPP